MKLANQLVENEFSLEFVNCSENFVNWNNTVNELLGDDGCLVQEWILAPEGEIKQIIAVGLQKRDPLRFSNPFIFQNNNSLPFQSSGIIARPLGNNATVRRFPGGLKVSAGTTSCFFSDCVYSSLPNNDATFDKMFIQFDQMLATAEMKASDLGRTWLFLEDIDRDYDLLNSARKQYFMKRSLDCEGLLPASTGVQGVSLLKNNLVAGFWAFSGEGIKKERGSSPKQCEPTKYKVLFNRLIRVEFQQNFLLLISGTASINSTGETINVDDCGKQMDHLLSVLETILCNYNASFSNVVQSHIYIKRMEDYELCIDRAINAGFPCHSAVIHITPLCRADLLCEVETIALVPCKQ